MAIGVQVGQTIGWRKLVSLAAVGLIAAVLAREWFGKDAAASEDEEEPSEE
jgi:predicted MFS family arabinose efflux permease